MTEQVKTISAKERAEQIRKQRESRGEFDGLNSRYPQLPVREGYITRWFNDKAGRIERMKIKGWEFSKRAGFTDSKVDLEKEPNKRIRIHAGVKEDGSDLFQYAMDIPEEIYNEDRAVKMASVDKKEKYIFEGKSETGAKHTADEVSNKLETNFKPD